MSPWFSLGLLLVLPFLGSFSPGTHVTHTPDRQDVQRLRSLAMLAEEAHKSCPDTIRRLKHNVAALQQHIQLVQIQQQQSAAATMLRKGSVSSDAGGGGPDGDAGADAAASSAAISRVVGKGLSISNVRWAGYGERARHV